MALEHTRLSPMVADVWCERMSSSRPLTVLHLQDGDYRYASRVLKEARAALNSGLASRVWLLGLSVEGLQKYEEIAPGLHVQRSVSGLSRRVRGVIPTMFRLAVLWRRFYSEGRLLEPDLIHCHSVGALVPSVALGLYHSVPVLYDAHELESQAGQSRAAGLLALILEKALLRRTSSVICVSDSIADWYASKFSLRRPVVVRNIPDGELRPALRGASLLRSRFRIPDDHYVYLYQGALSRGRRIEQLLRVFSRAPRERHIVFMGYGELQCEIDRVSRTTPNVHYHPAVPPDRILAHTMGANVGICGGENVCLSYYYSLPNKLFEYLHAGLPILIPKFPEMANVVRQHGCGWAIGESDEEWLEAVCSLSWEDISLAAVGSRAASQSYTWRAEASKLLAEYRRIALSNLPAAADG
jgi:glycosyltransferase involved in cell wall biosynthesis